MKNKKLLTQQIGYVSTAVDAKEGNLILEIPIISSLFEEPIEISAVYNSKNTNTVSMFGNRTIMNYYRSFTETSNGFTVKDAYGNEEQFTLVNDEYINLKTLTKLIVNTNILDDESEEVTFTLKDKYQNQIVYSDLTNYPIEIRRKDMSTILTSQVFFGFYKSNNEKVTFDSEVKCTKTTYFKDGTEETYSTNLEYDSQNRLTKVINFQNEEVEFEYDSDYIKIKHSPTNSYLKFTFTNNKVINIERGVLRGSLTPSEILITYNTDHTKITTKEPNILNSYHQYSSYVFFDQEGRLSYEFDESGYGYKLEYNGSDNVAFEGNVFNLKTTKNNLILYDGETQAGGQTLPTPFNLLGDEQYPLNGELVYQTENLKSKENTLSFFAKGTGVINIFVDNVLLDTVSATTNYELHQIRLLVDEINKPVTIKITGNGHIFGVKLQEGLFGIRYEYDTGKNLRKVISGNDELVYIYSTENKLLQIKENGKIIKNISYEKNKPNAYNNYTMDVVTEEGLYNRKQISMKGVGTAENFKIIKNEYLDDTYNTINIVEKLGINKYKTKTSNSNSTSSPSITEEEISTSFQDEMLCQTSKSCSYVSTDSKTEKVDTYINGKLTNHKTYTKNGNSINKYLKNTPYTYKTFNPYLINSASSLNGSVEDLNDATY